MKTTFLTFGILLFAGHANAANLPPPTYPTDIPIPAVLDLASSPATLPSDLVYQAYTTSFVATATVSRVTFVFRNDPGFFGFDDAKVSAAGTPLVNLLANPGFELSLAGNGANGGTAPDGWTLYIQDPSVSDPAGPDVYDATGGSASLAGLTPNSGINFWGTGAVGGYDGLSQTFATIPGVTYAISFQLELANDTAAGATHYQQISNDPNNRNGLDVVVYAGSLATADVPEPASMAIFSLGLATMGLARRRRAR